MRLVAGEAAALARLLAWDAPFLPELVHAAPTGGGVEATWKEDGVPLRAAAAWPRARRLAIAVQALAAAEFLFERGWYAGRALLWGARVIHRGNGDLLRLARPPRLRLGEPRLERRLRARPELAAGPLAAVVAPVLRALAPERRTALEEVLRRRPATAMAEGLLAVLTGNGKTAGAPQHPQGAGRALWARQLAVPPAGVFMAEDGSTLPCVLAAARLAAAAGSMTRVVAGGALEDDEIARLQARAAAGDHDALLLTSLPADGAAPLELAGGGASLWVFATDPALSLEHAARALELSGGSVPLMAELLAGGAARAFSGPPAREIAAPRGAGLASPPARRALAWLASSPIGLDEGELAALDGGATAVALAELERLRLVSRRGGRWYALSPVEGNAGARLAALAQALPERSWARCAALGRTTGSWRALEELCEQALVAGDHATVLQVGRALPCTPALALAGAEAALACGLLADAERLLAAAGESNRGARSHTLAAWWAELAGLPARAAGEIAELGEEGGDGLPDRLAAWAGVIAAEAARRRGEHTTAIRLLREAVACSRGQSRDVAFLLAQAEGPAAFRELRRREAHAWPDDMRARALHVLGYEAMSRGALAAAATGMRAALRCASGTDPLLLGHVHADLGRIAIMCDQPLTAERYLRLAERFLERAGSRRAVTVVRANRGVLACDRFEWRLARDLMLASRELRGGVADSAWLFEELELARADLARGDVEAVQAAMPRLQAAVARHSEHAVLRGALAALAGQLELSLGNLAEATAAAAGADAGERALIDAVVRAAGGSEPERSLPPRWGVALTAQALARWRRGDAGGARGAIEAALDRMPREAAVAFVRLATILVKGGDTVPAAWRDLRSRCEVVLDEAELDGWKARLHVLLGVDAAALLHAVDGVVAAGSDSFAKVHLEALGRALGVGAVEVRSRGGVLVRWGKEGALRGEVECGGVCVAFDRPLDDLLRAGGELLAHLVAGRTAAASPATPAGAGGGILGASAATAALRAEVARWAPLPVTVLILGEPGTGKELVARELHRASGRKGAFVAVNCAGIPATLLEAELFGVVRGAFTGADRDRPGLVEAAERGTLFLDEVGELPGELQAKLLRLLQEREVRRVGATTVRAVDVRFVAATNRDLKAAVAAGAFRQDLFYRLSVAVIEIPPLRERSEDIDELASHLLAHYAGAFGRPGVRLAPAALAVLRAGRWPGNVRELDSAIARAVAAARAGEVIGADRFAGLEPAAPQPAAVQSWADAVESFRRAYFAALLRATGGNRSEAARRAGLSRQALLYHLRHLGKLD